MLPSGRVSVSTAVPTTRDDVAYLEAALRTALEELRRLRIDVGDLAARLQRIERLLTRTGGAIAAARREGSP